MKNFRIFDGTTQYIAADECEVTSRNVVFYASGKIVRSYEIADVRKVEELNDAMRTQRLVFQEHPHDHE